MFGWRRVLREVQDLRDWMEMVMSKEFDNLKAEVQATRDNESRMATYIKGLADQLAARANEATDLEDYKSEMAELAAEMHSTNSDFAGLMTTPAGGAQVATAASGPLSGPIPVDDLPTNAQLNQTTDSPNPATHTVTPGGPNPAINPPASNKGPDDPGVEVQGFQGVPPAPIDPGGVADKDSPPSPPAGS